MPKIAINGFGRIGRPTFKNILARQPELDVVAINDLADGKTLAHLLKYDSNYGIWGKDVKAEADGIVVEGKKIKMLAEKDIANLPWRDLGIDLVIESTGVFTKSEDLKKHLNAGAKKVLLSAPVKGEGVPTYLLGVNADKYDPAKDHIVSMASCTTNGLAPLVKVLHENLKIQRGFFTTAHAYTNDQRILDLPHKDLRRARAAGLNIIPTSTGAAIAVEQVITSLKGCLDGIALRVPTPAVSIVDFVCVVEKEATAQQINEMLKKASAGPLKGVMEVSEEELVSTDFKGNTHSSIVDAKLTNVIGNLVKIIAWYDNEWAYSVRLAEMAAKMTKK